MDAPVSDLGVLVCAEQEDVPVVVELGRVTSGCWGIVGSACDTLVVGLGAGLIGGRFLECGQQLRELRNLSSRLRHSGVRRSV